MDSERLVGMRVMNTKTHAIGTIDKIENGMIFIDFHGEIRKYPYPSCFASQFELEDEEIHEKIAAEGLDARFDSFKNEYRHAINAEIDFLRSTGGKKYRAIDGERIITKNSNEYLYAFDTDTDMHFPDGTAIKIWFPENVIPAYVVGCEDFTIMIRTVEFLGETVDSIEFTAEQWALLEALLERLDELNPKDDSIAYEVACKGKQQITEWSRITCGHNAAFRRGTSEKVTFIWGPPGTGKTETLANIALEHVMNGKRVLMLSYSNVSVDGALLRVAKKADLADGQIIRYGYPRTKELLESKTLTSYQYVLNSNPDLAYEYQELNVKKRKLRRKDPTRVEINRRLNRIRELLLKQEKELIQSAAFIATTVSKATVDKALYLQRFDVVIFDEASMAYVPQIVFSASLAKLHFICLGDFRQLPAIVQNFSDQRLSRDIFEYTGITDAVEKSFGHEWLVMLNVQYRMHQDISDFVSAEMYGGMLKTSEKIIESREEMAECCPLPKAAISLVDLSNMYSVCIQTMDGSRINLLSALVCLRLAEKYIDKYEVGIITPYSAQSRLILSMIRDIQESDERWKKVGCATVHQFQGSEKPMIIYDAVDCFRMPYPGTLLTSMKNDTANRLFNVAMTRTKGKFIVVANRDFLVRKNISKKLIFTKALGKTMAEKTVIGGIDILDELVPEENYEPIVYCEDREKSWNKYIDDLRKAGNSVHIDVPDLLDENDAFKDELISVLKMLSGSGVNVCIRTGEDLCLPNGLQEYVSCFPYVTNPITIIDKKIVWYGQPISAADFITEGSILDTKYFLCARFAGNYTARTLQAFFEIQK